MAILEILHYPDPRLKQIAEPVEQFNEELQQFLIDLEQTMRAGPGGVGIAAPQVGRSQRIMLVDVSGAKRPVENHGFLILINPQIDNWKGMVTGREGCMSVPDFTGNVIRAEEITVSFQDKDGAPQQINCKGFEARAVQHEMDHLDGLLFLDRLVSRSRDLYRRK